jgi:rsbT co-antagonist protein RsbR
MSNATHALGSLLNDHQASLLADWLKHIDEAGLSGMSREEDVKRQAAELLRLLTDAANRDQTGTLLADSGALQGFLREFSDARVREGFTSQQTATFVFSLKRPVFQRIQAAHGNDAATLAAMIGDASELLDSLGLRTIDAYQKSRESVIQRQQEELLELSTPVVKLWDGVLALPIIGTLDSARTQVMMESLLERIATSESEIAIIDITGVPTVDTLVAQHLIKTVTAIRLMGADCIISGVRPQIAQTIVHLGVDLGSVTTKANLADALALAMKRLGAVVTKRAG